MSPPSFNDIGSLVDKFINEHLYWWSPNVKVAFSSQKDIGLLVSFITNTSETIFDSYGAYSYYHRALWDAELFTFPLKNTKLTFKYTNPCIFYTTLTFPLVLNSLQQELFLSVPTFTYAGDYNDFPKVVGLRSQSSYLSDNLRADLITEARGKKWKSGLSIVLK